MNPVRICHLTSVHPASDIRILDKECQSLGNEGYNVTFIVPGAQSGTKGKVRIVGLPPSKGGRLFRMTFTMMEVFHAALKENAHVYHLHDPELIPAGFLLKLLKRRKVIYDVHEDYATQNLSKSYIPKIARKSLALLIKTVEKVAAKCLDGIVTATEDILKNFPRHKNSVCVKNFPIISNYGNCKTKKEEKTDTFNIIYAGLIAEIRGARQIIEAMELLDPDLPAKLTLCGRFYPDEYEIKAKGLKGYSSVEYKGWIEPEKIPALLRNFDAGIVCLHPTPNYLTSLPVKLFEYMASCLPVIASNFPLWGEIIVGNNCGICVDPFKPSEIAHAIEHLMNHPESRREMGENGRNAVIRTFNWESESEKLISLYKRILNL
jgi:glycosyltransferase involved in cell wall biosynthesis